MLEKEFNYYQTHQKDLFEKYGHKYLVIVGEKVVGSYDSEIEAYEETKKDRELGTFLIQLCSDNPADTTQNFCSRVSFE